MDYSGQETQGKQGNPQSEDTEDRGWLVVGGGEGGESCFEEIRDGEGEEWGGGAGCWLLIDDERTNEMHRVCVGEPNGGRLVSNTLKEGR